jgi:5-methylcytosine-specific restriction endonuclease McrA
MENIDRERPSIKDWVKQSGECGHFLKGGIPWNKTGKLIPCKVCGEKFWIPRCRFKTAKYCSEKCSLTITSINGKYPEVWFKKGRVGWNKGKKGYHVHVSPEVTKRRVEMFSKPKSEEHKLKIKLAHLKRLEGYIRITPIQNLFRKRSDYLDWRKKVYERDAYTCQVCGQRGGKLQADHIKSFALYPELRLDLNNGRTLCLECHKKTETYGHGWLKKQTLST